jgi:hypothetical protein
MAIKRAIAMAVALAASVPATLGLSALTAPSASAASSCGAAVCMYEHANGDGAVLEGPWNSCTVFNDLGDSGFNDKISSIKNNAKYTQAFTTDAKMKGIRLNVGGHVYVSNVGVDFNDQISSASTNG